MSTSLKFAARYRNENAALGLKGWDDFMLLKSPDWLEALQKRSAAKVNERGLPTQKLERFKYTNIPAYLKKAELEYMPATLTMDGETQFTKPLIECCDQDWIQQTLEAVPAGEAQYGDTMLWDAANAFVSDGTVTDIPAKTIGDQPLNIHATAKDGQTNVVRHIVKAGAHSEFTIIEEQAGEGAYWHNGVTQIHVGAGARLKHYRFQDNSAQSLNTQNTHIIMEEGASYECFTLTLGAKTSRNQIHVDMMGANAEVFVNGINLLNDKQLGDATITVEHQAPHCLSKQNYRNVIADQGVGVFQGKTHVHQIAQKTDGYQFAKSLLMSPRATMNTKPELEIYADDVKCSHGTTSGQMDEDALFYMRSRGIPQREAERLLIEAFIAEVIEEITNEDIKERVAEHVGNWLSKQVDA